MVKKIQEVLFRAARSGDWSQVPRDWKANRDSIMSLPDPVSGDNAMHIAARAGLLHKIPKELMSVVAHTARTLKGEAPVELVKPEDTAKCIQNMTPAEKAYMRQRVAEHAESIKQQAAAGQAELVFHVQSSPSSFNI